MEAIAADHACLGLWKAAVATVATFPRFIMSTSISMPGATGALCHSPSFQRARPEIRAGAALNTAAVKPAIRGDGHRNLPGLPYAPQQLS
jgi:hypothetical protein